MTSPRLTGSIPRVSWLCKGSDTDLNLVSPEPRKGSSDIEASRALVAIVLTFSPAGADARTLPAEEFRSIETNLAPFLRPSRSDKRDGLPSLPVGAETMRGSRVEYPAQSTISGHYKPDR